MTDATNIASDKPCPVVNSLTAPYWEAAARGELRIQRCQDCRYWIHFPEPRCPQCGGKSLAFEATRGEGKIETFSLIHRSFVEGFQANCYAIAWIALPEQDHLRVMSNIVDCRLEDIAIGKPVTLCFEQRGDFGQLPQFTLT